MHISPSTWFSYDNTSINSNVHIFRLSVSNHLEKLPFYKSLLNSEELFRSSRFYRAEDRERYIVGRGVLKQLLGQYVKLVPELINIITGENKKPVLKDHLHLHFNISHSHDYIALAFSDNNIGIDVEYIDNNFNHTQIAETCFTDTEINFLRKASDPRIFFFMLWTRKEALLKANGKGVNDDMNKLSCLNEFTGKEIYNPVYEGYLINSFEIAKSYVAAVAYKSPQMKLMFYDI